MSKNKRMQNKQLYSGMYEMYVKIDEQTNGTMHLYRKFGTIALTLICTIINIFACKSAGEYYLKMTEEIDGVFTWILVNIEAVVFIPMIWNLCPVYKKNGMKSYSVFEIVKCTGITNDEFVRFHIRYYSTRYFLWCCALWLPAFAVSLIFGTMEIRTVLIAAGLGLGGWLAHLISINASVSENRSKVWTRIKDKVEKVLLAILDGLSIV